LVAEKTVKPRASSGLASEFYVTYQLYRRGYVGMVTYGNTKALDIVAANPEDNRTATIEVKSLKGKTNWPIRVRNDVVVKNHFYVLVGYEDRWEDADKLPRVWVIPASKIRGLLRPWSGAAKPEQTCVAYRDLIKPALQKRYGNAWHLLFPPTSRRRPKVLE
jgi:hypothetical protein